VVEGDGSRGSFFPLIVDRATDVHAIDLRWEPLGLTLTEALDGHPYCELALAAANSACMGLDFEARERNCGRRL
jgi:hypothetical protein